MRKNTKPRRLHLALLLSFLAILVWSVINPHDLFTWFLETFPAMAGAIILASTYNRFRFTTLVYVLIWLHAIILLVGGHYTYAEVPLFDWIRDTLHLSRNHYDRVGHFAQGFVPAMIAREFLIRKSPLKRGKLLFFIVVSICLAISALYELIEFAVSVATGSAGDAFLGTQGDIWDTQKDMALALAGAVTSLLTLSGLHDRLLRDEIGVGGISSRDSLDECAAVKG
jgi:putative membrane protein